MGSIHNHPGRRCRGDGGWIHAGFVAFAVAGGIMAAAGITGNATDRPADPDLRPVTSDCQPYPSGCSRDLP